MQPIQPGVPASICVDTLGCRAGQLACRPRLSLGPVSEPVQGLDQLVCVPVPQHMAGWVLDLVAASFGPGPFGPLGVSSS